MAKQSFLGGHLSYHPQTGTLSISFPGNGSTPGRWTAIRGASASASYHLNSTLRHLALMGPDVSFGVGENLVTFSQRDEHLSLDWNWTKVGDALESWLEITNRGQVLISLDRLDVLRLAGASGLDLAKPASDWRFFQNGWQSWSPAGVRRVGDGPFPAPTEDEYGLKHLPHGEGLRSEWVTVIAATTGDRHGLAETANMPLPDFAHLLFGFVTGADQLAEITLDAVDQFRALTATCYADSVALNPGETLHSERLRVASGPDGWGLLEEWAARMGELMGARLPEKTPTGWCTWYYYFGSNTAQDVYANLAAIRRQYLPLDLVMIDDGYQAAIGDWLSLNQDRYHDMASVAATIRREGRVPGIWAAPFGLDADSETWANHPDWVVRDERGEPVFAWSHFGQPIYALDTTHPDAAEWLHAIFHTMRHEWGYDAFKLDFLFAAALPGQRHDSKMTRAQAVRRGLAIIRDAIGDDAFLLACGAPMGPIVGLADGVRIGPNASPTWEPLLESDLASPGTANALRNSIARAFTHRRLWVADPDCLLARPRGDNSELSLYEARTLATVPALAGGMLLDGDLVGDLPPSRLAILRQTLPPSDRSAYPLDLFERDLPEILVLPVERPWGRWWLVGLVNWDNHTRTTTLEPAALGLPPGQYHIYDQWRASYLGQTDRPLTLTRHRPHETLLLVFKPVADRPDWLTSTFHLAAGSVEVVDVIRQKLGERRQKLVVHVEKTGESFGRLVFTAPAEWVVLDAQVNGRRRSVNTRDKGLVDMGFTLRNKGWVLVDFARV